MFRQMAGALTKLNQAADIAGVVDALHIQQADLVTHDIGNMVGYALAAKYRARTTKWVVIDAPLPGIANLGRSQIEPAAVALQLPSADQKKSGWWPGASVSIWIDSIMSCRPTRKRLMRARAAPMRSCTHGLMHHAFEQFDAFNQEATDNKALLAKGGKLTLPVLAVGGDKFFGPAQAATLRVVATNVRIIDENPKRQPDSL